MWQYESPSLLYPWLSLLSQWISFLLSKSPKFSPSILCLCVCVSLYSSPRTAHALASFMSIWCKLESFWKRGTQLRKWHTPPPDWPTDKHFGTSSWFILVIGGSSSLLVVSPLGSDAGLYNKVGWTINPLNSTAPRPLQQVLPPGSHLEFQPWLPWIMYCKL